MEPTLQMPALDWPTSVSLGNVPGARIVQVQGFNPDIDTGTVPELVWPGGGLFPWQATAVALEAVSTSANDAAAGTGGRTMLVAGLGNSHQELSEIVTLNGLTPVALVNQYRRVNSATLLTAGSGETNAGAVTVRLAGAGVAQEIMPAGYGRGQSCRYTVPVGYSAWPIEGFGVVLEPVPGVTNQIAFQFFAREPGGPWISRVFFTASSASPTVHIRSAILRGLPAGSDLAVRAVSVSASDFSAAATLNLVLTRV